MGRGCFFIVLAFVFLFSLNFGSACDSNQCELGEDCLDMGEVIGIKFCDFDLEIKDQILLGACLNDFECVTGHCIEEECGEKYQLQDESIGGIWEWLNGVPPGTPSPGSPGSCTPNWVCGNFSNLLENCGRKVCVDTRCNKPDEIKVVSCPGVEPFCGDNVCDSDENEDNCGTDCANEGGCGDGVCDGNESCESCSSDCDECKKQGGHWWVVWLIFILLVLVVIAVIIFITYSRRKDGPIDVDENNSSNSSTTKGPGVFPKYKSAPAVLNTPAVPNIPAVPSASAIPNASVVPNIPAIPKYKNTPAVSSVPVVPNKEATLSGLKRKSI